MKRSQQSKQTADEQKRNLKMLTETLKNRLDENQNPTSQSEASYSSSEEVPKRKKRKSGEKTPKVEKRKRNDSEKGILYFLSKTFRFVREFFLGRLYNNIKLTLNRNCLPQYVHLQ